MNAAITNLRETITTLIDALPMPQRLALGQVKWQVLLILDDFDTRLSTIEKWELLELLSAYNTRISSLENKAEKNG